MAVIVQLNKWANAHTNYGVDALRVLFGAYLFYKGVFFLSGTQRLVELLQPVNEGSTFLFLVHYVALSHLVGGVFIALGLLTRLCSLAQLPVLAGAAIINFIGPMDGWNLLQALGSFVLCMFFVFYGSGKHSLDYQMKLNT